jgi:hypothetical protein
MTSNVATLHHQAITFSRLFWEGADKSGKPASTELPSPRTVLAFVEGLLLCPTEEAGRVHIARDRESAELCRMYANDMASAFDIENELAGVERPIYETPFYLLASVLLRRAQLSVEHLNDNWKSKS